jgi:alpha-amylase/alpha-mannosidase (GH57 family)
MSGSDLEERARVTMSDEDSLKDRLDAARRRLQQHPGFREQMEVEALERTLTHVFGPNFHDLMVLLNAAAKQPGASLRVDPKRKTADGSRSLSVSREPTLA